MKVINTSGRKMINTDSFFSSFFLYPIFPLFSCLFFFALLLLLFLFSWPFANNQTRILIACTVLFLLVSLVFKFSIPSISHMISF